MSSTSQPREPSVILELGEGRDCDVVASVGELVVLNLTAFGTTGYSWKLEADESRCRVVCSQILPDTTAFGAPGTARFVVETVHPGTAELRLVLSAPWEPEPARTCRITLDIRPATSGG
jgi:predicted secreted protein